MINRHEFRLGNKIKVFYNSDNESIVDVDIDILENMLTIPERYFAIPLTPEWLERCGFEKVKDEDSNSYQSYSILKLDGVIAKREDGWHQMVTDVDGYYEQNVGMKLEFVHQLQNRYQSFTGEELNVKL